MAERNHLKIASQNDIADDDPFAELTKIMGFDPREPSRPKAAQDSSDDGFDIDLEKELMGEFDAPDDAPSEQVAPAGDDASASIAFEATDDSVVEEEADDLSLSLDDDLLLDEPEQAVEPEVASDAFALPEIDQAEAGPAEDDFEDAVVRSFESDFNAPAEEPLQFEPEEEAGDAYAFDAQQDAEPEVSAEPDAVAAESAEDDFDEAVFDDFELEPEEPVQQAVNPVAQENEASLDDATDDVDMDFDMPSLELADDDVPETQNAAAEQEDALVSVDAQTTDVADDLDLGMDLDDAFADLGESDLAEPDLVEPAYAAASVAPAVPAAAAPAEDNSLEDELNALLNRMSARPVVQPEAVAAPVAAPAEEAPILADADPIDNFDAAAWDLDIAADHDGPQAEAEEDIDPALLADLEAVDFSDIEAESAEEADLEAEVWEADAEEADAGENQPVADFDADDFDAELDKHFGPSDAVAPAVAAAVVSAAAVPAWQAAAQPRADNSWQTPMASSTGAPAAAGPAYSAAAPAKKAPQYEDMPDVETIDVPERVVALADDLDLPEVAFEEPKTDAASYDDLDAEFNSILNDMNAVEPSSTQAASSYDDDAYGAGYQRGAAASVYAAAPAATVGSHQAAADPLDDFDLDSFGGNRAAAAEDDAFDYDPDLDQSMDIAAASEAEQARPRNRLLLWAGAVAAVAVVGGVGAFALSFGGGSGSEAPAIVKADNQPIKVKPENPGGTVIPNQDNKVYDAVSKGSAPSEPSQQKLVTNTEEPVDVTAKAEPRVVGADPETDEAAAPTGKSEDRIEQVLQEDAANGEQDTALVTPRKVRTMVVRPDGSLVPREDPAPEQVSASEPADPAPQLVSTAPDATGAVNPQTNINALKPATPQGEGAAPVATNAPEAAGPSGLTPSVAPIAPQRPSDQPIDVVGEVKPDQVAAINPAASTAASGAWSMQIASQPTADSAQSTYQDLARRYSSVLNGRGVNIVKAEIAGKGTFYRVRVPAQSRNDAVELCTSYKAAGGNCFVSK